jgi:hypothetical protein
MIPAFFINAKLSRYIVFIQAFQNGQALGYDSYIMLFSLAQIL